MKRGSEEMQSLQILYSVIAYMTLLSITYIALGIIGAIKPLEEFEFAYSSFKSIKPLIKLSPVERGEKIFNVFLIFFGVLFVVVILNEITLSMGIHLYAATLRGSASFVQLSLTITALVITTTAITLAFHKPYYLVFDSYVILKRKRIPTVVLYAITGQLIIILATLLLLNSKRSLSDIRELLTDGGGNELELLYYTLSIIFLQVGLIVHFFCMCYIFYILLKTIFGTQAEMLDTLYVENRGEYNFQVVDTKYSKSLEVNATYLLGELKKSIDKISKQEIEICKITFCSTVDEKKKWYDYAWRRMVGTFCFVYVIFFLLVFTVGNGFEEAGRVSSILFWVNVLIFIVMLCMTKKVDNKHCLSILNLFFGLWIWKFDYKRKDKEREYPVRIKRHILCGKKYLLLVRSSISVYIFVKLIFESRDVNMINNMFSVIQRECSYKKDCKYDYNDYLSVLPLIFYLYHYESLVAKKNEKWEIYADEKFISRMKGLGTFIEEVIIQEMENRGMDKVKRESLYEYLYGIIGYSEAYKGVEKNEKKIGDGIGKMEQLLRFKERISQIDDDQQMKAKPFQVTVVEIVPDNWMNPNIWAWDITGRDLYLKWPGVPLRQKQDEGAHEENNDWLEWNASNHVKGIVINANNGSVQTKDIDVAGKNNIKIRVRNERDQSGNYEVDYIEL